MNCHRQSLPFNLEGAILTTKALAGLTIQVIRAPPAAVAEIQSLLLLLSGRMQLFELGMNYENILCTPWGIES